MKILELKHVSKVYGAGENAVEALRDVSLTVEAGEFTALVGTSGSGKTTLLNMIGGLDVPTEGEVIIRNHNIASLKRRELTIFRRRNLGFVFQNYSLMPVLNVYDNVALPVSFDKGKHIDHDYIKRLLQDLGLWDKRRKYPEELSGGQQQRTAIARALANKPAVILADEPQATWIPEQQQTSWESCGRAAGNITRPYCWSRTTKFWPSPASAHTYGGRTDCGGRI